MPVDHYYGETRAASTFGSRGTETAKNWQDDDNAWAYALPFDFPFYGKIYKNAYIGSNGTISFSSSALFVYPNIYKPDGMAGAVSLDGAAMIAALWDDLSTVSGNIYVDESSADAVTIRWSGVCKSDNSPVNFSATLYRDGTIKLSYGEGNSRGGIIGVSAGNYKDLFVSASNQSGSMSNADDIVLKQRLPSGFALQADGTLTGTPVEGDCFTNLFAVTDANGTVVKKDIKIFIYGRFGENTPVVTASLGTDTNGVKVAWSAVSGALSYEVWRSLDEIPDNAIKIATVNERTWFDETAVAGVHYTYFVRARGTKEMGLFGEGAEGWRPADLGVASSSFEGTQNAPFNQRIAAEGGRNLYSWALLQDGDYVGEREESTFAETGTAQGWMVDEQCREGSLATLKQYPMIAALWDDLTAYSSGDVYVESATDSVTFRWSGAYYSDGSPVNFSATLYSDGTIRLSYGTGNGKGGIIGISAGDGANWLVDEASESGSMSNAADVVFSRTDGLFSGFELHADGTVTGTPTDAGSTTIRVLVTDASGRSVVKEIEIVITGDVLFPELGPNATAAAVRSALSVGTDAGLTNNITDAAVYEAFRQWVHSVKDVDGTTAAGAVAVKDSTRAWLSFALGAGKLIGKDIASSDVRIVSFNVGKGGLEAEYPVFTLEVAIDGVEIGSGTVAQETLKANLKKVLSVEGTPALSPAQFSSDDIEVSFGAPVDGKARFTATPPADAGKQFFMRVIVK